MTYTVSYPSGQQSMMLQWRWSLQGAHVHVAVYTTPARDRTWTLSGTLVFAAAEWPAVIACLDGLHPGRVVFVETREATVAAETFFEDRP